MFHTNPRTSRHCFSGRMMILVGTLLVLGVEAVLSTSTKRNVSLVITSIIEAPFLMHRPSNSGPQYEGFCVDLIQELSRRADFNYTINPVKDGRYGVQQPDGTWNGMIGEIIRGEADLAVAPLTVTSARERVVDFTKPFMTVGISIMIKKPNTYSGAFVNLLSPFGLGVWFALLVACLVVGLLMFVIIHYTRVKNLQQTDTEATNKSNVTRFSFVNSVWNSLRSTCLQGCNADKMTRPLSIRTLSAIWRLFVIIVVVIYTAKLAAVLTTRGNRRLLYPVESAEDLSKQTHIKFGTLQGGSTQQFFRTSTNPVYERMWQMMSSAEPSVFVQSTEEGVRRVRESRGTYAFLMESVVNDYFNRHQPCDTIRVGPLLDSRGYGLATQAGAPLGAKINLALLNLIEEGFLEKLYQKWWVYKGECQTLPYAESSTKEQKQASSQVEQLSLDLSDMAGVFVLLLVGIVLALTIAIGEFLYARTKARKKAQTSKTGEAKEDKV